MREAARRSISKSWTLLSSISAIFFVFATTIANAQVGMSKSSQKISDISGGFTGILDDSDFFSFSSASLGDLDGDGIPDLAVGAVDDDDGGVDRGAVWILFLNPNGTVKRHQKISDTVGGFVGSLDDSEFFSYSLASLGDLDGDGVSELAVGAPADSDGGPERGSVWILFLNPNGTVKRHQKISDTVGGFTGKLGDHGRFGTSLESLGDLDGDGIPELAVGAATDADGGFQRGAVWILFLDQLATVKRHQKISDEAGGFTGTLDNSDMFGFSLSSVGDLDGDAAPELAVGALYDADGGPGRGAVWVLSLNPNGIVRRHQKISSTAGGFTGTLDSFSRFGMSLSSAGDLDGDGIADLAVGAPGGEGSSFKGAAWILFLNRNGSVKYHQKISGATGGFMGTLQGNDLFGASLSSLGDLDGDGVADLAVAAPGDDDGGKSRGAVWILLMSE